MDSAPNWHVKETEIENGPSGVFPWRAPTKHEPRWLIKLRKYHTRITWMAQRCRATQCELTATYLQIKTTLRWITSQITSCRFTNVLLLEVCRDAVKRGRKWSRCWKQIQWECLLSNQGQTQRGCHYFLLYHTEFFIMLNPDNYKKQCILWAFFHFAPNLANNMLASVKTFSMKTAEERTACAPQAGIPHVICRPCQHGVAAYSLHVYMHSWLN